MSYLENQETEDPMDTVLGLFMFGFVLLGGLAGGFYGYFIGDFPTTEIVIIAIGGAVAGLAISFILGGILSFLKK